MQRYVKRNYLSWTVGEVSVVVARTLDLLDDLVAHGRAAITTAEAADALAIPEDQVRVRMHRYVQQGRVIAPARGLWVPVPPQHRIYGSLPGLQLIDLLMGHLERDYYVGWLSAAEVHGAAHQAPQALQVAVSAPVQDRTFGRVRLPVRHPRPGRGGATRAADRLDRPFLGRHPGNNRTGPCR